MISFPVVIDPSDEAGPSISEQGYLNYFEDKQSISIRTAIREIRLDKFELVLSNHYEFTDNI